MISITIPRFFDAHVHLRYADLLEGVVPATARACSRAVVMPNVPAIEEGIVALNYRERILSSVPDGYSFGPLMTIKLTHRTSPAMIQDAWDTGVVVAAKVYPQGVTTGAHDGIRDFKGLAPVFETMQSVGMVLCVHCEDPSRFVLDRETAYLPNFIWALREFPKLKVIIEHVTSWETINFVARGPDRLAATITAHHLDLTLDDVIGNGIRPHNFCYPVAKYPADRDHLRRAVLGNFGPRFFLGSDSAPHLKRDKESTCGCAGIYSAPVLAEVLADFFIGAAHEEPSPKNVERMTAFTSRNGEHFYGLDPDVNTITLENRPHVVPGIEACGVIPYRAGDTLDWSIAPQIEIIG